MEQLKKTNKNKQDVEVTKTKNFSHSHTIYVILCYVSRTSTKIAFMTFFRQELGLIT